MLDGEVLLGQRGRLPRRSQIGSRGREDRYRPPMTPQGPLLGSSGPKKEEDEHDTETVGIDAGVKRSFGLSDYLFVCPGVLVLCGLVAAAASAKAAPTVPGDPLDRAPTRRRAGCSSRFTRPASRSTRARRTGPGSSPIRRRRSSRRTASRRRRARTS